jgi:intracellular sulfur oxidation DsrE/DsrF family protein
MDEYRANRRRLIGAGMLVAGASAVAGKAALAQAPAAAAPAGGWRPQMDAQDSWLDKPGTRHRMLFDSLSGDGGMEALGFANNFIHVNQTAYAVTPDQLGVVVIFRHMSTPYGYNNAVWAKYGKGFAEKMKLKDDAAKRAATMNPALANTPPSEPLPKGMEWANANAIADLAPKGVRFAVCGLATQAIAGMIAGKTGNAAAIEAEFKANLVPGALIVPAGISTVNRAQEHGYTLAYVG